MKNNLKSMRIFNGECVSLHEKVEKKQNILKTNQLNEKKKRITKKIEKKQNIKKE